MLDVSDDLIAAGELDVMIRERKLGAAWQRVNELRL
jgi:hypothetical protein